MGSEEGGGPTTAGDALGSAFDEHYVRLFRLGTLVTGDPVEGEDLVQEAFLRAAPKLPNLESSEVGPYLRTVVLNLWRTKARRRLLEFKHRATVNSNHSTPLQFEERDALWRLLLTLPKRQRACIALRYLDDADDAEIAVALGCSEATVRSQVSRGLARMREEYDRET